jgi:hypothetical protein
LPEGRRSGNGADSVLPYLLESLKAKPQVTLEPDDENPAP